MRAQVPLHSGDELTVRAKSGQYSFIADLEDAEVEGGPAAPAQPQPPQIVDPTSADAAAAAGVSAPVSDALKDAAIAAAASPPAEAPATGVPFTQTCLAWPRLLGTVLTSSKHRSVAHAKER